VCHPSEATAAFNVALEQFAGQKINRRTLKQISAHMTDALKVRAIIVRSIENAVAIIDIYPLHRLGYRITLGDGQAAVGVLP
jgi:hypothetical protein